jgi:hypothetical protein
LSVLIQESSLKRESEIYRRLSNILPEIKKEINIKQKTLELIILSSPNARILRCSNCCVEYLKNTIFILVDETLFNSIEKNIITLEEMKGIFYHEIAHIYNGDHLIPTLLKFFMDKNFLGILCVMILIECGILENMGFLLGGGQFDMIGTIIIMIIIFPMMGVLVISLSSFYQKFEISADKFSIRFIPKKIYINAILKMATLCKNNANSLFFNFSSNKGFTLDSDRFWLTSLAQGLYYSYTFFLGQKILIHPALFKRIALLDKSIENENSDKEIKLLDKDALFGCAGAIFLLLIFIRACFPLNYAPSILVNYIKVSSYLLLTYLACLPVKYPEININKTNYKKIVIYSLYISFFSNLVYFLELFILNISHYRTVIEGVRVTIILCLIELVKGWILVLFLFWLIISIKTRIKEKPNQVS